MKGKQMGSRAVYRMQTYLANRGRLSSLAKYGLHSITREKAQRKLDKLSVMEYDAAIKLEAFKKAQAEKDLVIDVEEC